jgi:hypothetical protein
MNWAWVIFYLGLEKEFLPRICTKLSDGMWGRFQTWSLTWCKLIIWSWEGLPQGWAGLPVMCLCCSCLLCMILWWPNFNIVIVMNPTKTQSQASFHVSNISRLTLKSSYWEDGSPDPNCHSNLCTSVLWNPFSGHKLNEARLYYG